MLGSQVRVARREQQRVERAHEAAELRRARRLRAGAVAEVQALALAQRHARSRRRQKRPERAVDGEGLWRELLAFQALVLHVESDLAVGLSRAGAERDAAALHERLLLKDARQRGVRERVRTRRVSEERVLARRAARKLGPVAELKLRVLRQRFGIAQPGFDRARVRACVEQLVAHGRTGAVREVTDLDLLRRLAVLVAHGALDAERERAASGAEAVADAEVDLGGEREGAGVRCGGRARQRLAAGRARSATKVADRARVLERELRLDGELRAVREVVLSAHCGAGVRVVTLGEVGLVVELRDAAVAQRGAREPGVQQRFARVEERAAREAQLAAREHVGVVDAERGRRRDAVLLVLEQAAHVAAAASAPATSAAPSSAAARGDPGEVFGGEVLLVHVVRQGHDGEAPVAVEDRRVAAREVLTLRASAGVGAAKLAVLHPGARHDVDRLLRVAVVEAGEARLLALAVEDLHLLDHLGRERVERRLHVGPEELAPVHEHAADGLALGRDRPVLDRHAGQLRLPGPAPSRPG